MSTPNDDKAQIEAELPDWSFFPCHWLAHRLQVDSKHIANLIESGEIKCAVDLRSRGASRTTIRIPRAAVVEFLTRRRDLEGVAAANPRPKTRQELLEAKKRAARGKGPSR